MGYGVLPSWSELSLLRHGCYNKSDLLGDPCSGGVVAFKLIEYLFLIKGVDKEEFYEKFLPYAAIATVCDVMPLTNENRIIVSEGLKLLRTTKDLGLNALIEAADIKKEEIDVYHLVFICVVFIFIYIFYTQYDSPIKQKSLTQC